MLARAKGITRVEDLPDRDHTVLEVKEPRTAKLPTWLPLLYAPRNCQTRPHCDSLPTAEQAVVGMLSCGVKLYLVAAGHEDAQGVANCGASFSPERWFHLMRRDKNALLLHLAHLRWVLHASLSPNCGVPPHPRGHVELARDTPLHPEKERILRVAPVQGRGPTQHPPRESHRRTEISATGAERNVVDKNVHIMSPQTHTMDVALAVLAHTRYHYDTLHTHKQV